MVNLISTSCMPTSLLPADKCIRDGGCTYGHGSHLDSACPLNDQSSSSCPGWMLIVRRMFYTSVEIFKTHLQDARNLRVSLTVLMLCYFCCDVLCGITLEYQHLRPSLKNYLGICLTVPVQMPENSFHKILVNESVYFVLFESSWLLLACTYVSRMTRSFCSRYKS